MLAYMGFRGVWTSLGKRNILRVIKMSSMAQEISVAVCWRILSGFSGCSRYTFDIWSCKNKHSASSFFQSLLDTGSWLDGPLM